MKITIGESSGFCFGVEKAVEKALKEGDTCQTFGHIIHNKLVVKKLEEKGIFPCMSVEDIKKPKIVIRSHGLSKKIIEEIEKKGVEIIDATCPFVKKIHQVVNEKSKNGYFIIIVGGKHHPEIEGILGYVEGKSIVIENEKEAEGLNFDTEKVAVVAQTTFSIEKYDRIKKILEKTNAKIVEIFDTICYTTFKRQNETMELAKKSDLMVVVGDEKSANTQKLREISSEFCQTIFVEHPKDLKNFNLDFHGFKNIGIVAGASTPGELIKEVKSTMEQQNKDLQPTSAVENASELVTMDDVMETLDKKKNFKRGQVIECKIEQITDDGLHLSLPNAKTEVLLPKEEINLDGTYDKEAFTVGEAITVKVLDNASKLLISRKAIENDLKVDEEVREMIDGKDFTMTFTQSNKGGLSGRLGTYSIFVPSSQIRIGFVNPKDFDKYKNKKLNLRVIKAEGKDIVASQRVILEEEKRVKEDGFWTKMNEGDIVKGKVMRFTNFGAFVSVDGFDCLAHISDLSWENIKSCEEVLEIGQEYDFKILKADREKNKVSLGFKQLVKRPIEIVSEKYPVGSIITGTITKIRPFGAFVEIEPKIEGLIHISQVSHTYVENIALVLQEGETVDAQVVEIDLEKGKINLSIKALLPEPERVVEDRKPRQNGGGRRTPFNEKERRADELTSWITGDSTVSIGDLLGNTEEEDK